MAPVVGSDETGRRHDAGWWMASRAGDASFRGWTDVPEAEVSDLELLNVEGDLLVRVPL